MVVYVYIIKERRIKAMATTTYLYHCLGYLLKEGLCSFWNLPNEELGAAFLDSQIHRAKALRPHHFSKLTAALDAHSQGLLSYFNHRISTAPLGRLDNKIKLLKRQAYGFRDML
jgi:transposase